MARNYEEPTVEEKTGYGNRDESITRHPAFCQIGASRVSGHTHLYDSDFSHNAYMTVTIVRSELHRGLSNDRHYPEEEIIRVAMSEAQWATFVASANMGGGVPCTLERLQGQMIPGVPPPKSRTEQFGKDMARDFEDTMETAAELLRLIDSLNLPKGKADQLRRQAEVVRAKLSSSIPFVAEQFDEHMESVVERGKAEVQGYMTGVIQRAGLTALGADVEPPLQLGRPEE